MKRVVLILFLILWVMPAVVSGIEVAPRITDKEIIERLTRLEEGQKSILREMDKRFEAIDKRFEAIDRRFDQLNNLIIGIIGAFSAIVAVTIGFAIWDRRSMIRPFEDKVEELRKTEQKFLKILKILAREDKKLAEVLKNEEIETIRIALKSLRRQKTG